jgi:NADH:ubiquinone oxidoreductase subunit 3 (subunit A)
MNFTFLVTVVLTGILFVGLVVWLARLISPRSFNAQKEEPYECGIPTRGNSWMQFKVGYYLFAILFLMFDVETMFLFPWAVVMRSLGPVGLFSVLFFLFILILGLAYAWRKGALRWQ